MPFRSRKQIAKMAMMEHEGKLAKGTVHRWAEETPNIKDLPNKVKVAKAMSK